MTYLAWAIFVEGNTDLEYFSTLVPRVISDLVDEAGGGSATIPETPVEVFGLSERRLEVASNLICAAKDAFFLFFVHGDTGSPAQEARLATRTCALCDLMVDQCGIERDRCVVIAPRRETEAWCLADKDAIRDALGLAAAFDLSDIPDNASAIEGLADPKAVADGIHGKIPRRARRRKSNFPFSLVAQSQNLQRLRQLRSFAEFDGELRGALRTLGFPNL